MRILCVCVFVAATTISPIATGHIDDLLPVDSVNTTMTMLSTGVGSGHYLHSFSISDQVTDSEYTVTWPVIRRVPFVDLTWKASVFTSDSQPQP